MPSLAVGDPLTLGPIRGTVLTVNHLPDHDEFTGSFSNPFNPANSLTLAGSFTDSNDLSVSGTASLAVGPVRGSGDLSASLNAGAFSGQIQHASVTAPLGSFTLAGSLDAGGDFTVSGGTVAAGAGEGGRTLAAPSPSPGRAASSPATPSPRSTRWPAIST
jgi:hypothetical protein